MSIVNKSVNNLRILGCQAVEKANSGHPGIVLGASPIVYSLYAKHLQVSNTSPNHFLRDRFVLSAGHGSAMLYSALHLFGFKISINDLKEFRQLGSITPGHPERDIMRGIETTTGPLGQGVANAVGMAIAESHLAATFNKPDIKLIDNYTYALVGDGCLMEGVANEALSLAGTLKLNKLIVIYDFNKITIDGKIDLTFKQNTKLVFKGYGFNVIEVKDGNSVSKISRAIAKAKRSKDKPTLIVVNTIIGFKSVLAGSEKAHGAPLGKEAMEKLHDALDLHTAPFEVADDVKEHYKKLQLRYKSVEENWKNKIANYKAKYPQDYKILQSFLKNDFSNVDEVLKNAVTDKESISTRDAGGIVLNSLANAYKNILGGAADLTSSTKTVVKSSGKYDEQNPQNRNIYFGVREFGMGAVSNGIALYGGLVPFSSTFFVFTDYMRASIRLASFMNLKHLFIFTHDSIGVGEDGPTHQPIEHLTSFRAMPNIVVFRPANFTETKAAFSVALTNERPTMFVLTRQNIKNFESNFEQAKLGGYVVSPEQNKLDAILIASGSEVQLALGAQKVLLKKGIDVRVVSMPSQELFEEQPDTYKNQVLPNSCLNRVSIEAGSSLSWHKYVGMQGKIVGIDRFGESGKAEDLFNHFNITVENVVKTTQNLLKTKKN